MGGSWVWLLGVVVHICNFSSLKKLKQEDCKLKPILGNLAI